MSRAKYEEIKLKATKWMEKAIEYEGEIDRLTNMLSEQNDDGIEAQNSLRNDLITLEKAYTKLELDSERTIMRKDAEIDRLKASLEDYKERYREMREDNKELRKSSRNM
jgi:hypothetical protein